MVIKTIKELTNSEDKRFIALNSREQSYKDALKDVIKLMKKLEYEKGDYYDIWEELKLKIKGNEM